jgi:hypothetical protein
VSHFFGCTPLGPVAWAGVAGATATATAISVLAPNWLIKFTDNAASLGDDGQGSATTQNTTERRAGAPVLRVVEPVGES